MPDTVYDLAVIGGGINGAGIAADAAGRGLSVVLVEMGDLAGATSSSSSKLIHGGLRYLEHRAFSLVRKALEEREILLEKAPHIVWPLRFVIPHVAGTRPEWMIRAGLFLYDHLARRVSIPGSGSLDLGADAAGAPLKSDYRRGFTYWDCWVDDARLVVLNVRAAADRGAVIRTRTKARDARVSGEAWLVDLEAEGGACSTLAARALVDATGPWAGRLKVDRDAHARAPRVRLVKGSHIVVPRIEGAEDAYLLQSAPDRRVVFALPFEERFTIIGTTDVPFEGDPATAEISTAEVRYLLDLANRFFRVPLDPTSVVWHYAGVRPLQDDGGDDPSAVSRDWHLALEAGNGRPALLTVVGGKVTTYRTLAEAALNVLAPHLPPMGPAWTATAPLPGGDLGAGGLSAYIAYLSRRRPGFPREALARLARLYGTTAETILGDARREEDLGEHLGAGLSAREVSYLKTQEWARKPEDILWRRTKAGVHLDARERERVSERLAKLL